MQRKGVPADDLLPEPHAFHRVGKEGELMSFLPGMFPAGAAAAKPYKPASMVFNGTNGSLLRTLATATPGTTLFTYSMWVKVSAFFDAGASRSAPLFQVINAPTNSAFMAAGLYDQDDNGVADRVALEQNDGSNDWGEFATSSPLITTGVWQHILCRYDSTQGVSHNRLRLYQNGALLTDTVTAALEPGASEAHALLPTVASINLEHFLTLVVFSTGGSRL